MLTRYLSFQNLPTNLNQTVRALRNVVPLTIRDAATPAISHSTINISAQDARSLAQVIATTGLTTTQLVVTQQKPAVGLPQLSAGKHLCFKHFLITSALSVSVDFSVLLFCHWLSQNDKIQKLPQIGLEADFNYSVPIYNEVECFILLHFVRLCTAADAESDWCHKVADCCHDSGAPGADEAAKAWNGRSAASPTTSSDAGIVLNWPLSDFFVCWKYRL